MIQFGLSSHKLSLETHHVNSTLKRRGNERFHVVSKWNTRSVLVRDVKLQWRYFDCRFHDFYLLVEKKQITS